MLSLQPHLGSTGIHTLFWIVLWCNGSTRGFGSLSPGSNPGSTTTEETKFRQSI